MSAEPINPLTTSIPFGIASRVLKKASYLGSPVTAAEPT
jgi:hypothetical protein